MNYITLEGVRRRADLTAIHTEESARHIAKAIRGSERLRDAILTAMGHPIPEKPIEAKPVFHVCSRCLEPIGPARTLISQIQKAVAAYYELPAKMMTGDQQYREAAHPRQVAMFLANELTRHSLAEIGRRFNRDHTTVMYALKAVKKRIEKDPQLADQVQFLRERLAA